MPLMCYGGVVFDALMTPVDKVTRTTAGQWASVPRIRNFPSPQFMGPQLAKVQLSAVMFPHETNGPEALAVLRLIAQAGLPQVLITGTGDVYGIFKVNSIEETMDSLDVVGYPREMTYRLELEQIPDDQVESAAGGLGGIGLGLNLGLDLGLGLGLSIDLGVGLGIDLSATLGMGSLGVGIGLTAGLGVDLSAGIDLGVGASLGIGIGVGASIGVGANFGVGLAVGGAANLNLSAGIAAEFDLAA